MADRRGGARAGAGRKKMNGLRVTVIIDNDLLEKIDQMSNQRGRSRIVNEAVAYWLKSKERADQ